MIGVPRYEDTQVGRQVRQVEGDRGRGQSQKRAKSKTIFGFAWQHFLNLAWASCELRADKEIRSGDDEISRSGYQNSVLNTSAAKKIKKGPTTPATDL
jgi:hypothetical protein